MMFAALSARAATLDECADRLRAGKAEFHFPVGADAELEKARESEHWTIASPARFAVETSHDALATTSMTVEQSRANSGRVAERTFEIRPSDDGGAVLGWIDDKTYVAENGRERLERSTREAFVAQLPDCAPSPIAWRSTTYSKNAEGKIEVRQRTFDAEGRQDGDAVARVVDFELVANARVLELLSREPERIKTTMIFPVFTDAESKDAQVRLSPQGGGSAVLEVAIGEKMAYAAFLRRGRNGQVELADMNRSVREVTAKQWERTQLDEPAPYASQARAWLDSVTK